MTREEQNKLWNDLPEEQKKEYREEFQQESELEYRTGYSYGVICTLEELFGQHNLKPALTYEDVARELFEGKSGYYGIANGEVRMENQLSRRINRLRSLHFRATSF